MARAHSPDPRPHPATAIDPVCGMTVDVATAKHTHIHHGVRHYFCNPRCREKFIADPARYLHPQAADAKPEPAGTLYTCPMHPEIVQQGPGICPICGMALEPKGVPPADAGPSPELVDFTRRLKVGAALSIPLLVIAMGPDLGLPLHRWISPRTAGWIELALATPVVAWCGRPFFERGWASIVNRSPNMWTLISIGVLAAYVYSLVAVLAPGLFPPEFHMHGGTVGRYFEAAAVIVVLVLVGQVLELKARERTGNAIRALLDLAPKTRAPRRCRRHGERGGARSCAGGRQAARAPRRGHSCRRPGRRGPIDGGRVAADRRAGSGRERPGRRGDRRHAQQDRQLHHGGAQGRRRDHARPHRRHGGRGAAEPRADPGSGRRRRRLFRPGGGAGRNPRVRRLADAGPQPVAGLRRGGGGVGADHRLPVRAGAGHADLHHGGDGPRRPRRRAHQERRGAGATGLGRYADRRQDRHADRGQADPHRRRGGGRLRRDHPAAARCQPGEGQRAPLGGGDRALAPSNAV